MMSENIECFIPAMDGDDLSRTVESFCRSDAFAGVTVMSEVSLRSTETLRSVAEAAKSQYILIYTGNMPVEMGMSALDRILAVAADTSADMLYADWYERHEGSGDRNCHPLIDCQPGALRDDFDFGPVTVYRASSFRKAVRGMEQEYEFAAMYDLRLRMKKIVHIREYLYTAIETDCRLSGEKQFDYVNPRNREVQVEMEAVCTEHLKRMGAWLAPEFREPDWNLTSDEVWNGVTATVVIPVFNRAGTIGDAVGSALSQRADFEYNVIVVDNHSTDGTSEILEDFAARDSRLVHLVPERYDLGIGGCWNLAVHDSRCGEFAIQLDSDDMYSGPDTVQRIVDAFRTQKCAMVIGSYMMTDFHGNPIPPGLIDHREWTEDNGRNNALRINGLGAPRAFWTPLLRKINFPNTSYGEDYAVGLRICREYRIGRIYEPLYLCRRWEGNSDAALDAVRLNANNMYKDSIRTWELEARIRSNRAAGRRK